MIKDFKLPDLGEGLTESEIVDWRVQVGEAVTLNQVIAEVETAKAVVELPSPYAGIVTEIRHAPGTVVAVGAVLISFDVPDAGPGPAPSAGEAAGAVPDASASSTPASSAPAGAGAAAPRRVPTLVGYGADPDSAARPARRPRTAPATAAPATVSAAPPPTSERPLSTPPVRKLARDHGLDLTQVPGTGPGGLITRADVLTASRPAAPTPGAAAAPAREERIPIKGVRKLTAQAMVDSAFTAPHVTEFLTIDVSAGMEFLARLRTRPEFADVKLSPLTLAARAVCLGIARQPSLNSRWEGEQGQILTMRYINLGIAAATPRGLLVPNIKEAQSMGLHALAAALTDLAATARAGQTTPEQLRDGTFTITNIGVFGIDAGTPILNPGEAGILALGAVRTLPWEYQGGIALRQVMTLSLSFDHRLVDGEQGSRFLADVGAVLADPALALALS